MMTESNFTMEERVLEDRPETNLAVCRSDSEDVSVAGKKKRVIDFSDSDNDGTENDILVKRNFEVEQCDNSIESSPQKISKGTRIKAMLNSDSDSDSISENLLNISEKAKPYESIRTENKKKQLKDKFKKLITPQSKIINNKEESEHNLSSNSDQSDDEVSCMKIKQKILNPKNSMKSICDPDTSDSDMDGECGSHDMKKNNLKVTKCISPKPLKAKMSAKQAMENMQKIKSESNRMLREKEVSLPYHRPKALSLKDIMSKRKPAVASDGKALPIKMNSEQLKQYAMMLEQRQKEVIQLCKSDTEEEENSENDEVENKEEDNNIEHISNAIVSHGNENCAELEIINNSNKDSIEENDSSNIEQNMQVNNSIDENIAPPCNKTKHNYTDNDETEENEKSLLYYSNESNVNTTSIDEEKDLQKNETSKDMEQKKGDNDSQILALHYDTEDNSFLHKENKCKENCLSVDDKSKTINSEEDEDFMDNDFNFDEISKIIEDSENINDTIDNENVIGKINNAVQVNPIPKLTGCPGSFIDLEDNEEVPRRLSGIELLKERFSYFANLKSLEEMEKDREKKYKPGTQHLKLKQELEQQIAEQRSMEWEKRLEEENKLKSEMNDNLSDDEIEKIEAKLESIEREDKEEEDSTDTEEEPVEDDVILDDKPKIRNPMLDDEAEVSECEDEVVDDKNDESEKEKELDEYEDMDVDDTSDSSDSEEEIEETKPRKGRILKAFEDSDDETNEKDDETNEKNEEINEIGTTVSLDTENIIKDSQDDDIQLAQRNISTENLLSSQDSNPTLVLASLNKNSEESVSNDLGTFSIMNSVNQSTMDLISPDKLLFGTHSQTSNNIESATLSQTLTTSQSQEIGEDIAALCTGKFYDNPFVSQDQNTFSTQKSNEVTTDNISGDDLALCTGKFYDNPFVSQNDEKDVVKDKENIPGKSYICVDDTNKEEMNVNAVKENTVLKSILDELDGSDVAPKKNKYFSNAQPKEENLKKKFIIDSDDEGDGNESHKKVKRLKKRKAEQRALQISDDEEDQYEDEQEDEESEIEEDDVERIVEYDSEENEVEVKKQSLKKRRVGEFFENEAELTSEDEWVGSGDEDERGLDRLEREAGDDDTFHHDQLQRELGQIHMREVLDQDKREVRLLQELLFEDGDLGDGHRQRKFRWRNADGEIESGTNLDELLDTQEEDFESEEQWRKQRHEREMFLRQMQEKDEDPNTSINRTTIIKANLSSRSMSTLISENKNDMIEKDTKTTPDQDQKKKTHKDIPSPKKPFTILQQNYHGSLLTRGRGALARLAALATPLATDDDTPKAFGSGNRGNFVFAAITPEEKPKVTKRKADSNVGTPRLIKKIKTDETIKYLKSSLFDHLKS